MSEPWTFWQCLQSAKANAIEWKDGVRQYAPFVIAHVDSEGGFVWARKGSAWTMGITAEDIIAEYDERGDRVETSIHG